MVNNSGFAIFKLKKNKKIRKIVAYTSNSELKNIHKLINTHLKERVIYSKFTKGYREGISIFDNAKAHMYNDIFIQFDIKNFFPSINHRKLINFLYKEVKYNGYNISKSQSYEIIKKASQGLQGLPLGFVTSPLLSNIYLKKFDTTLYCRLKRQGLDNVIYTRYADDITISFRCVSDKNDYSDIKIRIEKIVNDLLKRYSLKLNNKKTRLTNLLQSGNVKVTGVYIVNKQENYRRLTVGRRFKKELLWDAIQSLDNIESDELFIKQIRGRYSFVLSIEKEGIENMLSPCMRRILNEKNISSVHELFSIL